MNSLSASISLFHKLVLFLHYSKSLQLENESLSTQLAQAQKELSNKSDKHNQLIDESEAKVSFLSLPN